MNFYIYEDDRTKEYTQEWEVKVGPHKFTYYAYNDLTLDQARAKIAEVTSSISYITAITNMNIMVPRKVWQEDF